MKIKSFECPNSITMINQEVIVTITFAEWRRCGAEGIMNELEYPRIYCYTLRHVCLHITLRVMTKIGNGFQSAVCLQSVQGDIYQVSNVVPRVNTPSHITNVYDTPRGTHRSKITKKVHKPPRNHYIEWPVFSDIGLNCESQGEKGRTCKKYKILIGS